MRLFQNSALYPSYLPYFDGLAAGAVSFDDRLRAFLNDRFGVLHFLQPVIDRSPDAFFTNADDKTLQAYWARERGMSSASSPEDILLAQIEHHRTEVFYNLDPIRYSSSFVRRLPGCVRRAVCWRAAPSGGADLSAYDVVVSNFPSILDDWRQKGCNVALFFPGIDPLMDQYGRGDRPRSRATSAQSGRIPTHGPERRRRLSLPAARAVPPAPSRPFPQPGPLPRLPS